MIEVLTSGALNLVQDMGRQGYLSLGVSRSGAMDGPALALANQLVGNEITAASVEISIFPFRLRVTIDTTFACTGAQCRVLLDEHPVPSWSRVEAKAGQVLKIEHPTLGSRAYLAFSGGLDITPVMGSYSTDLKAHFGGHEGRALKRGDILFLRSPSVAPGTGYGIAPVERAAYLRDLASGSIDVRVLSAAEDAYFTNDARAAFYDSPYQITPQANRVGYRLSGTALKLEQPLELLSHGIIPGTVQVPPAGQPIVQMAEANTCGGYPKIATVIEADLWRLAQAPSGCLVRFKKIEVDDALATYRDQLSAREHRSRKLEAAARRKA